MNVQNGTTSILGGRGKVRRLGDAVDEILGTIGLKIESIPIGRDESARVLSRFVPAEPATFLKEQGEFILDGHDACLFIGMQQALDGELKGFCHFVRDAARTGAWPS